MIHPDINLCGWEDVKLQLLTYHDIPSQKQVLQRLRKNRLLHSVSLRVYVVTALLTDDSSTPVLNLLMFPLSSRVLDNVQCIHTHTWHDEAWNTHLISQSMQRSSQPIHASGKGQVRVGQGTAHQVTGVGTHITSFVVTAHNTHSNQKVGSHIEILYVCVHVC